MCAWPRSHGSGGTSACIGRDASVVFDHPALRARIRALFGPDWSSTRASGLTAPVPEYFARSSAPTELRIENADWVALRGCAPQACTRRHGLVLISPRGDRLLARIDDGGYTRESIERPRVSMPRIQKAHAARAYQNAGYSSARKIASTVAFGLT